MAVHFIIGSEGSGKTEYMYREMLSLCEKNNDQSIYYLVPDQATLQAQKELVAMQENGCVMNIDILSFSRLKYRLTEELGDCFPTVLDDIGKSMMLKKVLLEHDSELTVYGLKHKKQGFVDEMKSMLSELQRYLVDADRLKDLSAQSDDNILSGKLADLSLILKEFRKLLGDRFLTEEDVYSAMCGPVERSQKLKNSAIYLNGFTGFTPSQFLLLRSLMRVSGDITFALTMDAEQFGKTIPSTSIFHMTAKTIAGIQKIADEEGIPVDNATVLLKNPEEPGALSFLKNNLFRRNGRIYREKPDNVAIRSFANRSEEIRALIVEIERLIRKEGLRYREIAVICGDVPAYSQDMIEMMEAAEIPFFIDYKTDVMNNPLIDFIRSALRVLVTDFRMDTVTHYTKNCLSGYDYLTACLLDNYMLAKGVRGAGAFTKEFQYRYDTRHADPLPKVNAIREQLVQDLMPLKEAFHNAENVSEYVRILYDFVKKHNCYGQLQLLSEQVGKGEHRIAERKSEEYRRIYEVVMTLFDTLNDLLGPVELTLSEFAEVLDAGFREYQMSMIPLGQDCVLIGDVKRSRLNGIKHLFFLGVNDGAVPSKGSSSKILTDKEREQLKEASLELSELPKDSVPTEEFYLYLACAKPSDGLSISYRRTDGNGKETKPSYMVYRILNLLPELKIGNEYTDASLFSEIASDKGRRSALRALLGEGDVTDFAKEILMWFQSEEGKEYVPFASEAVETAKNYRLIPTQISPDIVKALYGYCLKGSVTMLENYAECGFKMFLGKGLSLEERAEFTPSFLKIGNAMHEAICEYSNAVIGSGTSFHEIDSELALGLMNAAIDKVMSKDEYDVFRSSRRNGYIAYCLKKILLHYTEVVKEQIDGGNFEPSAFEREFRFTSEDMELNGKIDRVDTCNHDGRNYVKIVDYKSSDKDIDFGKIFLGMQLQLPVYMGEIIRENGDATVPAAMFYALIGNPYVDISGIKKEDIEDFDEAIESARNECLKPSGIVLSDDYALTSLDHNLPHGREGYHSTIVPLEIDKNGQIPDVYSDEEIHSIIQFCNDKMHAQAAEIMNGIIERTPVKSGRSSSSCTFCPFNDMCRNVSENGTLPLREIPKMSREEFFSVIGKEED